MNVSDIDLSEHCAHIHEELSQLVLRQRAIFGVDREGTNDDGSSSRPSNRNPKIWDRYSVLRMNLFELWRARLALNYKKERLNSEVRNLIILHNQI